MKQFDSFDLGIEQVTKTVKGKLEIPCGLQIFFGSANLIFPGLDFSNLEGVSTLGDMVEIKISFGPTIKIRNDGWCKWE